MEAMTVNGVWNVEALPNNYIVELTDGTLKMFNVTPFREISDADLTPHKGWHPRKMKGRPMPEYLYRFYGLVRNDETMSEVVHLRLTPSEKGKLDAAAKNENLTISEYLRAHIRSL